jgi:glycosyltransferase involved in cell wall biosynthesis
MNNPSISVVIPLYDKRPTIGRALESVLGQARQPFVEVIVVDDGSTDGGEQVVAACARRDPRIRLVRQPNQGVAAARNRGAREAAGAWVALLDADDEWKPDFLRTLQELTLCGSDVALCATSYLVGDGAGATRPAVLRGLPGGFGAGLLPDYFAVAAASEPPVCSSAVGVRREALLALGGFPEGIASGEDLLTWARLAARHPTAYAAAPMAIRWLPSGGDRRLARPTRVPERVDAVGAALRALIEERQGAPRDSLRRYIAHWHKMRASCFLRLGRPLAAARELSRGLAVAPSAGAFLATCLASLHRR